MPNDPQVPLPPLPNVWSSDQHVPYTGPDDQEVPLPPLPVDEATVIPPPLVSDVDDAPLEFMDLPEYDCPAVPSLNDEPCIMNWKVRARVIEFDRDLDAHLYPSLAQTVWWGGPLEAHQTSITIAFEGLTMQVQVTVCEGHDSILHLGRDVLSGKLLIRC